ncbi:MAG: VWA domain-containing protein [Phycisphaerales bacterium]|nr:VWA domain-containing protein [Phycisphaerales bacterium]
MQFEHPGWLLLLVLLVPVLWMARHARRSLGPYRGIFVPVIRVTLLCALVLALAEPLVSRGGDTMTVAVVMDRSRSVPEALVDQAVGWIQDASANRVSGDQLAVVQVAQRPRVAVMPSPESRMTLDLAPGRRDGTDLAAGVELAKSILPEGGAHRILLVSDGNETRGALSAAGTVAQDAGIPIDVLALTYRHDREVLVERLEVPAQVRPGQPVDVRITLRAQGPSKGTLTLLRNGRMIPIEGRDSMPMQLDAGPTVLTVTVEASDAPAHRYEAIFEPDVGSGDVISINNRAVGFSFGAESGRVLICSQGSADAAMLAELLKEAGIETTLSTPAVLNRGMPAFMSYQTIVLVDVPRWSITEAADAELATWVRHAGGGLLVVGGGEAFGAGGWIGSAVAEVLPVTLDPPAQRQVRRGALVLILHSCEMPRGNYWGRRVAEAAIDSLTSMDLVGIAEYESRSGRSVWALPLQEAGDKRLALDAAASLTYGDMPSFKDSMQMAIDSLDAADAGQKHVLVITDGDPTPPSQAQLESCVAARITVSVVMVGGHGTPMDRRNMQAIAARTNGRFYNISDASLLPNIFIQEAQLVSRSLIQEGNFAPFIAVPGGPIGQRLESIPSIGGFVLTESRDGQAVDAIRIPTSEGEDPLLSWWQAGLGRVIAFTSDLGSRWAVQWPRWEGDPSFWERLVRWLFRSSDEGLMSMRLIELDDGEVAVELESVDDNAGFMNFVETQGVVLAPGGEHMPLELRQVSPGRYRGSYTMTSPGAWVTAVRWRGGQGADGSPGMGWLQGATVLSWAEEDSAVRSNEAMLESVANQTGGRVFDLDVPPELANFFDRAGLTIRQSTRSIWGWLAVASAILLLFDVAVRRIVPDARTAAARRRRSASGPSSAHATEGLRQVKERVANQAHSSTPIEQPVAPKHPSTPIQPHALREDADEDADDTLSRLRAARRRLRREDEES